MLGLHVLGNPGTATITDLEDARIGRGGKILGRNSRIAELAKGMSASGEAEEEFLLHELIEGLGPSSQATGPGNGAEVKIHSRGLGCASNGGGSGLDDGSSKRHGEFLSVCVLI